MQGYEPIHHEAFALGTIGSRTGSRAIPATPLVVSVSAAMLWHAICKLSPEVRKALLPHNFLLVDWMPYDVSEEQLLWMEQSEGMRRGWRLFYASDCVRASPRKQRAIIVFLFNSPSAMSFRATFREGHLIALSVIQRAQRVR